MENEKEKSLFVVVLSSYRKSSWISNGNFLTIRSFGDEKKVGVSSGLR